MEYPKWYESTQGPQIAASVKSFALLLLPVLKQLFGIELGSDTVDAVIDALLILSFGAYGLFGYIRAKRTLGARIERLEGKLSSMGATLD